MQWYYAIDGRRSGPVSHSEFERLAQAGTFAADTLVWRQGMDQWQTLAEVKAANPGLISDAPPPLPAADQAPDGASWDQRRLAGVAAEIPAGAEVLAYAGFWRRLGAHLVDLLLWWFVWQLFVGVIGTVYFPQVMAIAQHGPGYQPKPEELGMLVKFLGVVFLIGLVWAVIYDAIFVLKFAATPGKLLFGIRLVQPDGRPLGFPRIVARCLAKCIVGFTLGIGYLIVAFDDEKRGLHDYICNTRVVKKR